MNIIYGAGVYGKKLYDYFLSIGIAVDAFCQTELRSDDTLPDGVSDMPLLSCEQLKALAEKCTVHIAIRDWETVSEIKEKLMDEVLTVANVYDWSEFIRQNLTAEGIRPVRYAGNWYETGVKGSYWKGYLTDKVKLREARNALIEGLSKEDTHQIDLIIDRMGMLPLPDDRMDIFTPEEKKRIRRVEHDFIYGKKLLENDEGSLVSWNGYLWPKGALMEAGVFYYQCGMSVVDDKEWLRDKAVIDAGAYIGDSAVVLSKYTNEQVYAFEPFMENYCQIENNCILNNVRNVIPVKKGLSDATGEQKLYVSSASYSHGLYERQEIDYEDASMISTVTLDSFVEMNNLTVGLVKVDIEGGERKLIQGAERIIREQSPTMLISIYHTAKDFFGLKGMIAAINPRYHFKIFQPYLRTRIITDTLLICEADHE